MIFIICLVIRKCHQSNGDSMVHFLRVRFHHGGTVFAWL
jgi:hypothetical protein